MKSKGYYLILFAVFLSVFNGFSQNSQKQVQKIDSLFTSWNVPNHPGGSVLITMNGKTIFSRAYGLASIEHKKLNTNKTLYNIGSISKQFTAIGIVLLEEQDKLSFDDDISRYIPEFPDFGTTITIRHLLHHTSGLRDIHGLLGLAGWRRGDLETNEDLYRIIENQKELNFQPGEEFLYSNTGYILLAKIIENVEKLDFDQWMQQNIFEPLGLKNTYVEVHPDRVVENNATSYYSQKEFKRAIDYWGYYGAGNMHSTTEDLNLWLQNFMTPQKNWATAFNKLLLTTPLNNGYETNYGFGVRIENYSGKKVIQHGGSVGGFRGIARVFPEEQLNIVILTNFSKSNIGSKINKISDIILEENKKAQIKNVVNDPQVPTKFTKLSNKAIKKFEGIYWSDAEKSGRKVYVKNDTLRYSSSQSNEWALMPIGKNTFRMIHPYVKPIVKFDNNTHQMTIKIGKDLPGVFTFLQSNLEKNTNNFDVFVGDYYSPELKTIYSISKDDKFNIYLEHTRHGKIKLTQLYNNVFSGNWPIGIVEIKENKEGGIIGLRMSNGRTRNVWFKKMKQF